MISYNNFNELKNGEVEGRDYRISVEPRDPCVLIMAPHGGKIEPTTAEIAEAIAGEDYSFYIFEGLKADGNSVLHSESHFLDEHCAVQVVREANVVITVHGQIDQKEEFVMIGGLHDTLRSEIKRELEEAGFQTREPIDGLTGTDPKNICNRGKLQQGVQLEISRKVRDSLKADRGQLHVIADSVRRAIRMTGF